MAILRMLFPNFSYLSAFSGGNWQTGDLSLQSFLDPVLRHVARSKSTNLADTRFDMAIDRPRYIGGVALLGHNLTIRATIRVITARDAGFTDIISDQTFPAYPRLFRSMDLPWSSPNWWMGRPLQEDIDNTTTGAIYLFPETVNARYIRFIIDDQSNEDGFIEIGKVFAGPSFEPPHNYRPDAQFGIGDSSTWTESYGGTRYFNERGKRRRMAFGFDMMNEAEQFGRFFDFVSKAGITKELLLIPDADDLVNIQRRSFCGHCREPSALEQVVFDRLNVNFVVEELI